MDALPYLGLTESLTDLERRIDALGGQVAIVGPKGSGKTTLLEAIAERFEPPVVLIRIPGNEPHPGRCARSRLPARPSGSHTILIDGAERLGAFAWRSFLRAATPARRIIATQHQAGRLPTLVTCATDPGLLRRLVSLLAPRDESDLDDLFRRHDGNIRSCFRELYDVYAGRHC